MNKKRIFTITFFLAILIASIIYGINTRKSWKDDTKLRDYIDKPSFKTSFIDWQTSDSFKEPQDIRTFQGLYNIADVIVRVNINSNNKRNLYSGCIITEAEVIETYKGRVEEKKIDIIEPNYIDKQNNEIVSVMDYIIMEDNSEYILFLYKRKFSGYGKSNIYIPTSTSLSKYKYDSNLNDIVGKAFLRDASTTSNMLYKDCKIYDIVTVDQNIVDFYNNNANEIRRLLNEG